MKNKYILILSLLSTGLLAGAFFYGTLNVIPALYDVPIDVHLKYRVPLMNHNAVYMQLLTAIAIIAPVWLAIISKQIIRQRIYAFSAGAAALISILVTRIGNVPINHLMRTWNATEAPANWPGILHQWDIYNYIRTGFAITSFVLIVIASQVKENRNT